MLFLWQVSGFMICAFGGKKKSFESRSEAEGHLDYGTLLEPFLCVHVCKQMR